MTNSPSHDSEPRGGRAPSASAPAALERVVHGDLPVAAGLRAYSEEVASPRLRRGLQQMADELAAGRPLEAVISEHRRQFPETVAAIIDAGIRTGRLGVMLEEFLLAEQRSRNSRRRLWLSLLYPALLLMILGLVGGVFAAWCLPQFRDMFESFGLELPPLTIFVLEVGRVIEWLVSNWIAVAVMLIALVLALKYLTGPSGRRRVLHAIPVLGNALRNNAAANYCRTLALLIEGRMNLPDAFRMMSRATPDPALGHASRLLASRLTDGEPLVQAAEGLYGIPPTIRTLFRWEQNDAALIQGLRSTGELHDAQADLNTGMIAVVAEPTLLVTLGLSIGIGVIALFMPMFILLKALS
ncbi:Type II secretion system protein F [Maioricimonas rarisocia]|uniref:Type II secretion system protein F n=1 Tax=Maioricimonas rarisocia TaxID=2528026 RepID=A0A517ZBZ7_9PLAN|nr:type II secretion system F family protein [Maioricimonas rarisocia]QDU39975.1 Type II secretion system protein F [Maioricimonas rarisocia]